MQGFAKENGLHQLSSVEPSVDVCRRNAYKTLSTFAAGERRCDSCITEREMDVAGALT